MSPASRITKNDLQCALAVIGTNPKEWIMLWNKLFLVALASTLALNASAVADGDTAKAASPKLDYYLTQLPPTCPGYAAAVRGDYDRVVFDASRALAKDDNNVAARSI